MNNKNKASKDHIFPTREGGPDEPYNWREISVSENSSKGAEMPTPNDVLVSSNPGKLAADIDIHSINEGFSHPRNKDKGFGGLPKR